MDYSLEAAWAQQEFYISLCFLSIWNPRGRSWKTQTIHIKASTKYITQHSGMQSSPGEWRHPYYNRIQGNRFQREFIIHSLRVSDLRIVPFVSRSFVDAIFSLCLLTTRFYLSNTIDFWHPNFCIMLFRFLESN